MNVLGGENMVDLPKERGNCVQTMAKANAFASSALSK